ncbi:hypothetical protein N7468_006681 [Penicillium chermesinum]|uniref:Uncharacterized protein n=1 Tax=Penicillium chermesinum TaxID=63820 RepID=A0A9W9TJU5_9EURO|nr:uncharacterized protein N7468_006681 [Penicillium chermesinum]KAJ5225456.1 hypothetical protein N7468_006681 [Penicillium chermesinum]KAJ6161316.1 hypothetical protein N7470_004712 [Penicillium chermesinum]
MSGDINTQVDMSSLSLADLGQFSTQLSVLSADNVQPAAMLQLQELGAVFPTSGPVAKNVPNHLLRCKSRRIERLGLIIGWREGDSASLMAQSAGGQAISLVATCLWNTYGERTGEILYDLSGLLLPHSSGVSSPDLLNQAAEVVANKLAIIGFGSAVAEQTCRIYDAYQNLAESPPDNILAGIPAAEMVELLSKASRALREDKSELRIRGTHGMGYVAALAITLFSDDCVVTLETSTIHNGKRSASIFVEIQVLPGADFLEVHFMDKIDDIGSFFNTMHPEPHHLQIEQFKFFWKGSIAAMISFELGMLNLPYSSDLVEALAVCALAMANSVYIHTNLVRHLKWLVDNPDASSRRLLVRSLGDDYLSLIRQRYEFSTGLEMPQSWPSFPEARKLLVDTASGVFPAREQTFREQHDEDMDSSSSFESVRPASVIPMGYFMHRDDTETYGMTGFEGGQGYYGTDFYENETFSWDERSILEVLSGMESFQIAWSTGSETWVPAPYLALDDDDICSHRYIEVLDGSIIHNGRYYREIRGLEMFYPRENLADELQAASIKPSSAGAMNDMSMQVEPSGRHLTLQTQITVSGQTWPINFTKCVAGLFGLLKTVPCEHSRMTPLKDEYSSQVLVVTVAPFNMDPYRGKKIVVQTAGNPIAQIVALWGHARVGYTSILCQRCCLNCAFEQSRKVIARTIIVS